MSGLLLRQMFGGSGAPLALGSMFLSREALIGFARDYDPQPFHMDETAAQASLLNGLASSGWQTCALQHAIVTRALRQRGLKTVCREVPETRWLSPLRPEREVFAQAHLLPEQPDHSDQTALELQLSTREDGLIMTQISHWGEPVLSLPDAAAEPSAAREADTARFSRMVVGEPCFLGEHHFGAAEIDSFNQAYEAAGARHLSPWLMAGGWMRAMLGHRARSAARPDPRAIPPSQFGPSPGFEALRWCADLPPGTTLRYTSTLLEKRAVSRPGWGLITSHNQGFNAMGTEVFRFRSRVFVTL